MLQRDTMVDKWWRTKDLGNFTFHFYDFDFMIRKSWNFKLNLNINNNSIEKITFSYFSNLIDWNYLNNWEKNSKQVRKFWRKKKQVFKIKMDRLRGQ